MNKNIWSLLTHEFLVHFFFSNIFCDFCFLHIFCMSRTSNRKHETMPLLPYDQFESVFHSTGTKHTIFTIKISFFLVNLTANTWWMVISIEHQCFSHDIYSKTHAGRLPIEFFVWVLSKASLLSKNSYKLRNGNEMITAIVYDINEINPFSMMFHIQIEGKNYWISSIYVTTLQTHRLIVTFNPETMMRKQFDST